MTKALEIKVYGLVQGVGFRPFLHRLAGQCRLSGWALNTDACVQILVQGQEDGLESFLQALSTRPPPLARVERLETKSVTPQSHQGFKILPSRTTDLGVSRISPDIAVCPDCLSDILSAGRRSLYPFTNCTNCGPRFSIIKGLPYDRSATTMHPFPMCPECRSEYQDIGNRRYHAQPNACPHCGPHYQFAAAGAVGTAGAAEGAEAEGAAITQNAEAGAAEGRQKSKASPWNPEQILRDAVGLLRGGGILALKGIGGFHLVCDAANEKAVRRLRDGKRRDGKPFAVMCATVETVRTVAEMSAEEEELAVSLSRPVVLLQKRRGPAAPEIPNKPAAPPNPMAPDISGAPDTPRVAPSVTRGLHTLGVMLPYAPIHHLLFAYHAPPVLVMTSGNWSGEPLRYRNETAVADLSGIADAFLLYNREIHNRCDDSVAFLAAGSPRIIRRSRGMVPEPIDLGLRTDGIVAGGGELKNCFALGTGESAVLSQHIGDLKNYPTLLFYRENLERFLRMYRVEPRLAACDLHPDYHSSREMRGLGVPVAEVQHHHAHIVSCMAEEGLEEPVIGVSFDGTGYGPDGAVWGGEFLLCDRTGYSRKAHLEYVPLPGGDKAAEEPWRMALSYARHAYSAEKAGELTARLCGIDEQRIALLLQALDGNTAAPPGSSAGRLFDAVAALLGLVQYAEFEAEAPMRLEGCALQTYSRQEKTAGASGFAQGPPANALIYPFELEKQVRTGPIIRAVVEDVLRGVDRARIALAFHRTLAEIVAAGARRIREEQGVDTVVLSGGVFQNRLLLELSMRRLREDGFRPLSNRRVPANDGGLALGQLAVAAALRRRGDFDIENQRQNQGAKKGRGTGSGTTARHNM